MITGLKGLLLKSAVYPLGEKLNPLYEPQHPIFYDFRVPVVRENTVISLSSTALSLSSQGERGPTGF